MTAHHQNCAIRARQARDSVESLKFLADKDPTYRENFRQAFVPSSEYAVFTRSIDLHNFCQLSHISKGYIASIYNAYCGKSKDVLCLFLHDFSRSEIAAHLHCSEKTVTNALTLLVREIELIVSDTDLPDTGVLPFPEDVPPRANYRNAGRRRAKSC